MKLCYSTLATPEYTVDDILRFTSAWGFDGIELRTLYSTPFLWDVSTFQANKLEVTRQQFVNAGIEIPVFATGISFSKPGYAFQEEQLEHLKRSIEIAKGLGCSQIRVFGGPFAEGQSREDALQWAIQGYLLAMTLAKEADVKLLLETHDDYSTTDELLPLLSQLEGIGVVWDVMHPARCGESPEITYNRLKDKICHVHIKDGKVNSRNDVSITQVGEGDIPIPQALKILKNNGYNKYYCCEWERFWHPELEPAEIILPQFANYMRSYE